MIFEIPLLNQAQQQLTINLAGTIYTLTLKWNVTMAAWGLDIGDISNNPIVTGIPLLPGVDLLEQYGYLKFGGSLYAYLDHAPTTPPGWSDLGKNGHLFFVTNP